MKANAYSALAVSALCVLAETLSAGPAHAKLTPAQKCAVAKLKAAAKKADSKAKCTVKKKFAAPADSTCLHRWFGAPGQAWPILQPERRLNCELPGQQVVTRG